MIHPQGSDPIEQRALIVTSLTNYEISVDLHRKADAIRDTLLGVATDQCSPPQGGGPGSDCGVCALDELTAVNLGNLGDKLEEIKRIVGHEFFGRTMNAPGPSCMGGQTQSCMVATNKCDEPTTGPTPPRNRRVR